MEFQYNGIPMQVMQKKLNIFLYFILCFIIFFFIFTHSANLEYDTPSYINFDPIRPPLYPLFIWLFRWAGSYQFNLVIFTHGILLFLSFLYTRNWLNLNLKIPNFFILLIFLFILLTISFHSQLFYVQSEGITFPLFIITFFLLIDCFYQFNVVKISFLALLVSLLVLSRLQFYYFYCIFSLLCLWYYWQRIPIQSMILSIIIFLGSIITTHVIDHGYHYFKHGFFGMAPYSGSLILVQTLYLTDDHAANYFKKPEIKEIVQKLVDMRNTKNLNQDSALTAFYKPSYYEYAYQTYARNYSAFSEIIFDILYTNKFLSYTNLSKLQSNNIASAINKTLIIQDPKKNLLFFLWKLIKCIEGVTLFLFLLIILIVSLFKIIRFKIKKLDRASLFIILIPIITFFNAAIIAICNPYLPPYFCYSQFMLYCLAAFLAKNYSSIN